MPEELVDVFSDDGEAGTKRPKDKVSAWMHYCSWSLIMGTRCFIRDENDVSSGSEYVAQR